MCEALGFIPSTSRLHIVVAYTSNSSTAQWSQEDQKFKVILLGLGYLKPCLKGEKRERKRKSPLGGKDIEQNLGKALIGISSLVL